MATSISPASSPRIFVAIPSFRDAETQWTVSDLFAQAEQPSRIAVGICWQLEAGDEATCFSVPYPRPAQVREIRFPAAESLGSTWARAQALSLSGEEEYVLLIDSHMRFEPGWDTKLIGTLEQAPGRRTALTAWLPGYQPPRQLEPAPAGQTWRIGVRELTPREHPAVLRLRGLLAQKDALPALDLTPLLVGNFLFARRDLFAEVPLDPNIFMYGQEISLSARLWTHGYDIYQPRDAVLYHYWKPLPVHLADSYKHVATPHKARTAARVRHLLKLDRCDDPEVLRDLDRYGHGQVRRLADFWRASGVDPQKGTVAPASTQGQWNRGPGKAASARPRIFVNIPSYRDTELQWTVRDLFAKASHPERVFVGICWQLVPGDDAHCFVEPYPRPEQVRIVEIPAEQSLGATWARAQAWSLWRGEEYVLSIDAHMRFESGWDQMLIDMIAQCPSDKPILTTYPMSYTGRDECDRNGIFKMAFKEFVVDERDAPPKLMYQTLRIEPKALPDRPFPTATVAQGFVFAPSLLFQEIPFDPHVYFFGDDLSLATRAWTSGWDIFSPHRNVVFHLWDRTTRPGHWNDQPAKSQRLRLLTQQRVAHLVGIETAQDQEALTEIERYGLGQVRTLAQYCAFSGVDFARRMVSADARKGDVSNADASRPVHRGKRVMKTEGAIVIDDFLPEAHYQALFDYASRIDYQYINTQGAIRRVWDLSNGFPLRSEKNLFVHAPHAKTREGSFHYPSQTPLDHFVEAIDSALPDVGALVGQAGTEGWNHYSVTSWIYPPNTGLSMHDDGAGIYSGAYVYYLNPEWRPHWGGLLIVLDDEANQDIGAHRRATDAQVFHSKKWLHLSGHDELAMQHGLGRSIFPKRNRMVFIAPDTFHMVTRVLPEAGDNARLSLAGFFHRHASAPAPK